ncbi:MATE efflux family protein [Cryphonectria parasitica EP155]|uniref:MATE efflux family protein n=1 Tax=Cryphonectria parasitica (strain ATCC 38755 / EP155) TaxID=660469 RepID=A0A9P4Y869_CRYP1|nr:MATE efflux family protein [Cryphonectria parasitica EP155]KAF3768727.1 MATE efflux family protein [Cryphonectria parasitica EP155]
MRGQQDVHHEADESSSELWLLTSYSLPLIATYLLQYSFFVIITVVAGHLGPDDLAAASIGVTTMNVVGLAVFEGMATALDTLCAQAYGSGNPAAVGLHVQRMLLLMALAAVPIGLFWACSPWVLPLVVRQHDVAVRAGLFLQYSLVGLPGYAAFEALKRFLQAQGDCNAGMAVLIVCAPVNAVLSWALAFPLGMGLEGAALGAALSNNLRFILLLLYIVSPLGRWSHGCWGGFSREALRKWGTMVSLSTAGAVATLAEWGAFEILTLSTSYISTEHLAAQTILTTATVILWHIPFSISVAVSTRLGHLIGGGLLPTARRATHLYLVVFAVVGLFNATLLYVFRHHIPSIFSDDAKIQAIAANSFLTVALFQSVDSVLCGTHGLMRGLGRQDIAAWIVFVMNYAVGVPLAMWLELGPLRWELDGIWVGFAVSTVATSIAEGIYMRCLRWQRCVESVKAREEM